LAASTVRAIDLRYLERWAAARRKPVLAQSGHQPPDQGVFCHLEAEESNAVALSRGAPSASR